MDCVCIRCQYDSLGCSGERIGNLVVGRGSLGQNFLSLAKMLEITTFYYLGDLR